MKQTPGNKRTIGILAMIGYAFFSTIMGIWVRLLAVTFSNFQQIAVRALVGALLGYALYGLLHRVDFSKRRKVPRRDVVYIILRSVSVLVGIILFTYAINTGNFSNINMIYALPSTAILGMILFGERMTGIRMLATVIGIAGVAIITVRDFSSLTSVGPGELAALASTFFYSYSAIVRKNISDTLTNEELSVISAVLTGAMALVLSLLAGDWSGRSLTINPTVLLTVVAAGTTYILIGVFGNYGMRNLEAIVANNLMILEALFGLLIGIMIFAEAPTLIGLIGGMMVVSSAVITNYADAGSKK